MRRALPQELAELPPEEAAKVAARERKALRLGDLSEEERRSIEKSSDSLGPFRTIVQVAGGVALVSAVRDLFFVLIRLLARSTRADVPESVATGDQQSLLASLFLLGLGAALLYAGIVLMAPQPVPTMKEMLADVQEAGEAPEAVAPPDWSQLLGTWHYGEKRGQSYSISKDVKGRWRYDESLKGQAYSATLSQRGRWLQGSLLDSEGKLMGSIRVRPGEGHTAVSYFMETKAVQWGNKNTAFDTQEVEEADEASEGKEQGE